MAPGPQVMIDLDIDNEEEHNNNAANLSIRELISSLQTEFRTRVFDEAESILTSREAKSKLAIDNLIKENELLKEKFETERLNKISIETELQKHKAEILDKKVISERDGNARERIKNLVEEVKEKILELQNKNCEVAETITEIKAMLCAEALLGEPLSEDEPGLGMEFDPLPHDSLGPPIGISNGNEFS